MALTACATAPPASPPAALLDTARRELAAGQPRAALVLLEELLARAGADADAEALREEAMHCRAVCLARAGDHGAALAAFETFVEAYPLSPRSVETEVFELGVALIEGAGSGFLGIPRALGLRVSGPEVLRFLIRINPRGEHASDARRILAQDAFDRRDFELARLEYEALIEDHPGSIWQGLAEFRIALCRLRHSRGAAYDRKLLEDALKGFRDYEQRHPGGDHADRARRHAQEIGDLLAEKNYRIADFYLADKRVDASVFYHRLTLQEYPETDWARRSAESLAQIARGYPDTAAARAARTSLEQIGR